MAQQDFIQKSEDYWLGRLSEEERQVLEVETDNQPESKADLQAYGQLFQGFTFLQEEHFREKLQAWNQDWQDKDDTELVEAYLLGQLNENATKELENRIEQDDTFAQAIAQHREIAKSLEAARSENFNEKLQKWSQQATDREGEETDEENIKPIRPVGIIQMHWRKLAAAAAVILVLVVALQLVMKPNYSDVVLAAMAYEAPRPETTMGADNPKANEAFVQEFERAHRLFSQGDYGAATAAFERLQGQLEALELDSFTKSYYQDNLVWNELLAQLGSSKVDANFRSRLEGLATDSDHTYQKQAEDLLRKLNSIWR